MTKSDLDNVALAALQRNVENCKNGWSSCDQSKLTGAEAKDAKLAEHRRNVENCVDGLEPCDRSTLTTREANAVSDSVHERNSRNCMGGGAAATTALCQRQRPTASPLWSTSVTCPIARADRNRVTTRN